MSWYELLYEPMVAKGLAVATMEKPKEFMVVEHLKEIAEREAIT